MGLQIPSKADAATRIVAADTLQTDEFVDVILHHARWLDRPHALNLVHMLGPFRQDRSARHADW